MEKIAEIKLFRVEFQKIVRLDDHDKKRHLSRFNLDKQCPAPACD